MYARIILLALSLLAVPVLTGCETAQRSFETPEAAVSALEEAVASENPSQLREVLGPRTEELKSGDAAQDRGDFVAFAYKLNEKSRLEPVNADESILLVGAEAWPFPAPLVRTDGRWRFDTDAGIDELTTRRIGANELAIIDACNAFIDAEAEYRSIEWNDGSVSAYTPRLMSTPGTRDGLYWETGEDETPSPIGPVMAAAISGDGSSGASTGDRSPFYGYFFKVLTRQGPAAPGGAMDYVDNGQLVNGVAAVAFPAEYGRSGIMTFIFSMEGTIYQRDLGAQTASIVAAMDSFDPSEGWTAITAEQAAR